jgi:hypothetical protein
MTKWSKAGFEYQFRSRSQCIAFKVGSSLGPKKVFNIGAGFTLRLMPQNFL